MSNDKEFLNHSELDELASLVLETQNRIDTALLQVKSGGYSQTDVKNLEELMQDMGESFQEMLFRKIREKNCTDIEVYKRAGLDRKLFSKIRKSPAYHPKKSTAIALALALELSLDETDELLRKAGYSLAPASVSDQIIRYFIEKGVYDLQVVNYALAEFQQPVLS